VLGAEILTWNDWDSPGENRTWNEVKGVARERTGKFGREGAAFVGKKTWRRSGWENPSELHSCRIIIHIPFLPTFRYYSSHRARSLPIS
jgi:hypothetical protein